MFKVKPLLAPAILASVAARATASVSYSEVSLGDQPDFAESSKFNFLGLAPTPMEQLTELRDELGEQCGDQGVTGMVAKTSTINVIIGLIEKTELMGYCAEAS